MTRLTPESRRWRALIPVGLLIFSTLTLPLAAAGSTCGHEYGEGASTRGSVTIHYRDDEVRRVDSATWIDGCHGKGCDDQVSGVYRVGGVGYYFHVEEVPGTAYGTDTCDTKCDWEDYEAPGQIYHWDGRGYVYPHSTSVSFSCWSIAFSGEASLKHSLDAIEELDVMTEGP